MNLTYGPLRPSPASLLPTAVYPVVAALPPAPDDDDRHGTRRRRTMACRHLTVNGERLPGAVDKRDIRRVLGLTPNTTRADADVRCDQQPGIQIATDWATDICLSSWCRGCPFAAGPEPPTVRYTIASPEPDWSRVVSPPLVTFGYTPRTARTEEELARRTELAEHLHAELIRRGIFMRSVDEAFGTRHGYVSDAIKGRQPGPLARIAAYLAEAH